MTDVRHHAMPDGRRIAYRFTPGRGPVTVFLPGYMSDMAGSKAAAVFERAVADGRACLLLDYSGCGLSDGEFAHGTLSRWQDEALALIDAIAPGEPLLLAGSSMGGWLMLLLALELGERVRAMVGIAAAPDFTEWGFDAAQKGALAAGETVFEDNPYGPAPTPTHPGFWTDGQARLLGDDIAVTCPVRLIQGQADRDVPWQHAIALAAALRSPDVQVTLIKDGDHRLSRMSDISLLLAVLADLTEATPC
jgi:pimeloyl-ACP methyl ester carboxylesterase